jgi:predicted nucleic acid-binding protein
MIILLDTNIFIQREDYSVISPELQNLIKLLNLNKENVFNHPKSIEELYKNKDKDKKEIILSKVRTYPTLDHYLDPNKDDSFMEIVGKPSKINDDVDNYLIYTVYKNMADILISEDLGIIKKAKKLNLSKKVLTIQEALTYFSKEEPRVKISKPPSLVETTVNNINFKDPIFESLRYDYKDFDNWIKKIKSENRKCWVHYTEKNSIGAILIYKEEKEPLDYVNPPRPEKMRFKICTMKVSKEGKKIGELFIRLSIEYCIKNGIEELYLTHFSENRDTLVDLVQEYGFINVGYKKTYGRDEEVYLKDLNPDKSIVKEYSPLEIAKKYYPMFKDSEDIKKLIIPIRPEYCRKLFIEGSRQTLLSEHSGEFITEGNPIKKAYLCHSNYRDIAKGDILIFYRSGDEQDIFSLGIVDEIDVLDDPFEIYSKVFNRSVYSLKEIMEMTEKPVLVILFLLQTYLKNPISLSSLLKKNILKIAPPSITRIKDEGYQIIKKEGEIDGRFTIN